MESAGPSKPRPKEDVLGEILENTRMLSSRIRKMEFENEKARGRPDFDANPSKIRDQVRELIQAGLPAEIILEEFRRRAPSGFVRSIIAEAEQEKACP